MSDVTYPAELEIAPLAKPVSATVSVPGSKSITNRALVLAALTAQLGPRTLTNVLKSEDTEVMLECLRNLGFQFVTDWTSSRIEFRKNEYSNRIPSIYSDLYVANSGTTVRFLTAMLSLGKGRYGLFGVPRMHERPIQDLLDTLSLQLGVNATSETGNGCPPVRIEANGLREMLNGLVVFTHFGALEPLVEGCRCQRGFIGERQRNKRK